VARSPDLPQEVTPVFDTAPPTLGDGDGTLIDTGLTRPLPGVVLLTAAGEVDTLTAPRLEAALGELVDSGARGLVADLTGITFLASSGLAVLIRAAHRAEADGRRLRLVTQGRPVLRPLQITGTDGLFDLHTDLDAALAAARD
jgi:anti-sigma B factor antagonist